VSQCVDLNSCWNSVFRRKLISKVCKHDFVRVLFTALVGLISSFVNTEIYKELLA